MHGRTSSSAMSRTVCGRTRHTARAWRARWGSRLSNTGLLPSNKTALASGATASQIGGAVAAARLLRIVLGGAASGLGSPELAHGRVLGGAAGTITPAVGFMVEAVLAFFLVTVVLTTSVAGRAAHLA